MNDLETARAELIKHLDAEIRDKRVLAAISRIPREQFIPPESRHLAYEDGPLPIGWGQTISQPYIIALMTEALELKGNEKVLEVGTGSGYQTAILAGLARTVISVERVPELAESARRVLGSLGYKNIEIHLAEETLGWQKKAPYDAIMVTAGAPDIPQDLLTQLGDGGRMVIPAGSRYIQELYKVTKHKGKNRVQKLGGCRFVALIGKNAWGNQAGSVNGG
ncbi:MAG: protein-L-isoaspartate O-methyltransferase [Chloroflexi bacterium RBG_16_50_11]|nr:MAG: protein-L-isoaspartate O-methyltransferase [Chloroflexi bacterium RBG_16_50_11]